MSKVAILNIEATEEKLIMRSTFSQPYDEEFARRWICLLFPELGYKLKINCEDPPDLIDEASSVGIEVVQAVDNKDAELSNAFAIYKGKKISCVPEKLLRRISSKSRRLICDDRGIIIGASFSTKHNIYRLIEGMINKKQKRLNCAGYRKFERNGLFIYNSSGFCFEKGIRDLISGLCSRESMGMMFDFIIIYCGHEVWFIDVNLCDVKKRLLSDEEIDALMKDTLFELKRSKEYYLKREFLMER